MGRVAHMRSCDESVDGRLMCYVCLSTDLTTNDPWRIEPGILIARISRLLCLTSYY